MKAFLVFCAVLAALHAKAVHVDEPQKPKDPHAETESPCRKLEGCGEVNPAPELWTEPFCPINGLCKERLLSRPKQPRIWRI